MTDSELIEFASEFREGILDGDPSRWMCAAVCWPLSTLLEIHGVENEVVETDLGECNHFWLRLKDGRALDPTADQFNDLFPDLNMPPVYLGAPGKLHSVNGHQVTVLSPKARNAFMRPSESKPRAADGSEGGDSGEQFRGGK